MTIELRELRTHLKKGIGNRPHQLVHLTDDPHFTPKYTKECGLSITFNERWEREVIDMIPDGSVHFEVIKGTVNTKHNLGHCENILGGREISISFIGSGLLQHLSYELFVVDKLGKKIWSTSMRSIHIELSDNQRGNDDGWCSIREDINLKAPYIYRHLPNADKPLITVSQTIHEMMKNSKGFYFLMHYSFFIHVMSSYIYTSKNQSNSDYPKFFIEILKDLNDEVPIIESEEDGIINILEQSETETLIEWLSNVTESIFLQRNADDILEKFLSDNFQ